MKFELLFLGQNKTKKPKPPLSSEASHQSRTQLQITGQFRER